MWPARINFVVSVLLIVSGFVDGLRNPELMIIAGIVVTISGLWGFVSVKSWEGILNCFAGLWLVLCGSWFNYFMPWNFFVTGGIIFVFAVWNLNEHPRSNTSPNPFSEGSSRDKI